MKRCPRCNTGLPEEARFCWQCGAPQEIEEAHRTVVCRIDLDDNLEYQLNQQFFVALRDRIEREHDPKAFPEYSECMYLSGFRDVVLKRIQELAILIREMQEAGEAYPEEINALIEDLFEELLDQFIVLYCKDLNEIDYPEAILKYQLASRQTVPLLKMILDYLSLVEEGEEFYTDLLRMPLEKLQQAGKSFLFPTKEEKILLIADQSVLGTCKEGFAFTDVGFYWKAPMEKPRYVAFKHIQTLHRKAGWITINGYFFNASTTLNLKMLRLLDRLRRMFQETDSL